MPADAMLERIAQFIARHRMFPPSARVGVAVSGGADSVFLLAALRELAPRWNLQLSVVHIDHGIRGEASRVDAAFVQSLAERYHLPFHLHRADVAAIDDNLEQAGRRVRQALYMQLLSGGAVDRIATGHTRSDQAETVLYRILRGAGLSGLSGILPVTNEGLVRPLLEINRAEIECWLRKRNFAWREDATNQDRAYARNRIRHEILPRLRENFNPRLDETLARMAALALDEEAYWTAELARHGGAAVRPNEPQILSVPDLAALPVALARRLIRRAVELAKGDLRQVDYAHIERILEMARRPDGHDRANIPGLDVLRSFDLIRLARPQPRFGFDFSIPIQPPTSLELPRSATRITLQVLEKRELTPVCGKVVDELDWERFRSSDDAPSGMEVRNWRPGDQYRRVGQSKPHRIKAFFQTARVPLWERQDWPIVTYNGSIVWAKRLGAAAEFAATPTTRVVLQIGVSSECRNRLDQT